MFLDNILASLTLQYLFSLWIWDLTVLFLFCFCFPYLNQVLTYFNKCNLFIAICTYLSIIGNPSGISLLFEPILVYDSNRESFSVLQLNLYRKGSKKQLDLSIFKILSILTFRQLLPSILALQSFNPRRDCFFGIISTFTNDLSLLYCESCFPLVKSSIWTNRSIKLLDFRLFLDFHSLFLEKRAVWIEIWRVKYLISLT